MSNSIIAILRVVHIAFGAFKMGGAITRGFLLLPAVQSAGSVGGQFAAHFMART